MLKDARNGMISAVQARDTASRLMETLKDPEVITGVGANGVVGFQALANKLGFTGPESVAKTQAIVMDLAKNVLSNAAALKPLSDHDIKFLKDVTAGTADLNRETLLHAAGIAYAAAHNSYLDNQDQFNSAKTVKGADEIAKLYPAPAYGSSVADPALFKPNGARLLYKGTLFQPKISDRSQVMPPAVPAPAKPGTMSVDDWLSHVGGR